MSSHRHVATRTGAAVGRAELRTHRIGASVGLGVVGLVAGLLFSTSASLAADSPERRPGNLRDLVRLEQDRLAETNTELTALQDEVRVLLAEQSDSHAPLDPAVAVLAGSVPVSGPGLVVKLWDAPIPANPPEGLNGDDYVVHQQDLESVMNALWAGGAEAMTVQGHRVTATTSVRCVGNVLLIDGATYSPPYEIAVIGDTDQLREVLFANPTIVIYLQYVDALHLGWSVEEAASLDMPADDSNLSLEYADAPG